MRFVVCRVKCYEEPGPQPCEGAVLETLHHKAADEQVWVVEVADLDALLALRDAVGKDLIVSGRSDYYGGMGHITIYDGYIE